MIITISGRQGAGKTTLAKKLSEKLNMNFISIGDLRGMIAQDKGMTIDELNEVGKKEKWVHEEADKKTEEIGRNRDNFIVEGWAVWHFIPHSKKIFLEVDQDVGAERVFKDQRSDERPCKTVREMKDLLKKRLETTNSQFIKYYGAHFLDKSNYDIIIDTTNLSEEEMTKEAIKQIKKDDRKISRYILKKKQREKD